MTENRIEMGAEEFVRKVSGGERDLAGIVLSEGACLDKCEGYEEMNRYLREQNLSENPVNLSGSRLAAVKARRLHLPHVKGEAVEFLGANLYGANLEGANLMKSFFSCAELSKANLKRANLEGARWHTANMREVYLDGANLREAYLMGTNLERANLYGANLEGAMLYDANLDESDLKGANLERANLRNVRNLEYAYNLGGACFGSTKIDPDNQEIIRVTMGGKEPLFDTEPLQMWILKLHQR